MSLKWGRFQTLHMRQEGEKTKWAFDTRPDDGGPPRPVYIGNMQDWDPSETRTKRWTTPITPGATKAVWGQTTFQVARYRCCHDLDNCGVRVKVRQGNINAWNFAREWSYGFKHASRHSCINKRQYIGESRFHLMTKLSIARVLRTERWGRHYNIRNEEVHVEKYIGDIKPDVHFITNDNQTIIIEVVVTNDANRYKHDTFERNMVLINLRDLGVTDDDSTFDRWVKAGGIEEVLQEELDLNRRIELYNQRNERFAQVDQAQWERDMRQFESKCREKFGFNLASFGRDIKDLSNKDEMEKLFLNEKERRDLLNDLEAEETKLIETYGEKLDVVLADFNDVEELKKLYRDELGEKLKQKRARQKQIREEQRKDALRDYLYRKCRKTYEAYGTDFRGMEQEFDTREEVNAYFEAKVAEHMAEQEAHDLRIERYRNELHRWESKLGIRSKLLHSAEFCSIEELENLNRIQTILEGEAALREQIDEWHTELSNEFGFFLDVFFVNDRYVPSINELRQRYQTEVDARRINAELMMANLRESLDRTLLEFKESLPVCAPLFDLINQDEYIPTIGELGSLESRSYHRRKGEYMDALREVIRDSRRGISIFEDELKAAIEEFIDVVNNNKTFSHILDVTDFGPVFWKDIVSGKYGRMLELQSQGWQDIVLSKTPLPQAAKRYISLAKEMISGLGLAKKRLEHYDSQMDSLFQVVSGSFGLDETSEGELEMVLSMFPLRKLSPGILLNSAGNAGLKFSKHRKSETLSKTIGFDLDYLKGLQILFEDKELQTDYDTLAEISKQALEEWQRFVSSITTRFYSPKIHHFEIMWPYLQSSLKILPGIVKEQVSSTSENPFAIAKHLEPETLIPFVKARIIESVQEIGNAINHLKQKGSDLVGVLVSSDELSRRVKDYKKLYLDLGISMNLPILAHLLFNWSVLFKPFPSIEQKLKLLVSMDEDVSNFTNQEMETLFMERVSNKSWKNPRMHPLLPASKSSGPRKYGSKPTAILPDQEFADKINELSKQTSDWHTIMTFIESVDVDEKITHEMVAEAITEREFNQEIRNKLIQLGKSGAIIPMILENMTVKRTPQNQ